MGVIFPLPQAGNISEFLLREGYGHCVDWSISVVTQGREKLRLAEKLIYRRASLSF